MLEKFIEQQLDYILFINGLAFILLVVTCIALLKSRKQILPWSWLTVFALFQGVGSWLACLVLTYVDNPILASAQALFKITASIGLFEFARKGNQQQTGAGPNRWIYLPILAGLLLSTAFRFGGAIGALWYLFGVFGGVWSALVLYRAFKGQKSLPLGLASLLALGFALTVAFNILAQVTLPASLANLAALIARARIPIYLLRAVLALCLASVMWLYLQSTLEPVFLKNAKRRHKIFAVQFIVILMVILITGWIFTDYAGRQVAQNNLVDILKHTNMIKTTISAPNLKVLRGAATDQNLVQYGILRHSLINDQISDDRIQHIALLKYENGHITRLVDSLPVGDSRHALPGTPYLHPPESLENVFLDGKPQVLGPYTDGAHSYISGFAAIRAGLTNEIIGVVSVNYDAAVFQQMPAKYRLAVMLVTLLVLLSLIEFMVYRQNTSSAAQEIAASQNRLIEAQAIAKIGNWSARGMMEPMEWSDEMFSIFGLAKAQGAPTFLELKQFIHPDDWKPFEIALGKMMQTHEAFQVEYRLIRPDKSTAYIYTHAVIREGEKWDDIQILGISQDISERKASELKIWKLSQLIEQSPDSVVITDLNGNIEYVNPKFSQITGYTLKEVLGKNPGILKSDELSKEAYQHLWDLITSGREWHGEFHNKKKNGDFYWESTSIFPLVSESGETTNYAAVKEDITARKQMEEALHYEQHLMQTLMDTIPDTIYFKDADSRFIRVNQAWMKKLGLADPLQAIGKTDFDFFTDEHARAAYENEQDIIRDGTAIINQEEKETYPNRPPSWVSTTKMPMRDKAGQINGTFGISRDITEEKCARDELRQTHEELAQTNLQLANASQVKSQFLANMSHEIRTPLNAIIGMTGLLMDTSLTEEQQDFAATVRTSGEVLLALINDILDFSKIEARKMELENQSFNLRRCIEEALDLLIAKASEKKIELAYMIDSDLPTDYTGDVTRIRQILVNLISNAVKFTEKGEVVISVSGKNLGQDRHELHFSVRDTGIGIPADRVDRLFQSFSQVDTSTTRRFGGTGLGLAISKRLCELMGGSMWVESDGIPDHGSTFHFTILTRQDREALPVEQVEMAIDLSGLKILIVDDNKTNRDILFHYTSTWAMQPTVVSSAHETIEILTEQAAFDLVLLDLQMPDMDGISLAKHIQGLLKEQIPPVILLSSLGYREAKGDEFKFAAYLSKPIKPSQLFDSLRQAFTQKITSGRKKFNVKNQQFDRELGLRHPLHILLAEDNPVNQTVALSLLGRLGYHADVAANGVEALDALRRRHYDLVFMDGQMPEMDGIEATRCIRQQMPVAQQPRIVAMTANAMKGDRENYLAAGMDDYISKPIYIDELIRALSECQHAAGRAEPAVSPQPIDPALSAGAHFSLQALPDQTQEQSEAESDEQPAVTLSVLQEFKEVMGEEGDDTVNHVVMLYLRESPVLINQMCLAVQELNFEVIRRAAHTLKGNSSQIGAFPLADRCFDLEKLARTSSVVGAGELVAKIQQEFVRVGFQLNTVYPEVMK